MDVTEEKHRHEEQWSEAEWFLRYTSGNISCQKIRKHFSISEYESIEAWYARVSAPETPAVPERLRAALEALPSDYVIVPRSCFARLMESTTWDAEANNGYGGWIIPAKRAIDNMVHDFVLQGALNGDYEVYEDMWGPDSI